MRGRPNETGKQKVSKFPISYSVLDQSVHDKGFQPLRDDTFASPRQDFLVEKLGLI